MKSIFLITTILLNTLSFATECDKSLEEIRDYIKYDRNPPSPIFSTFTPGQGVEGPVGDLLRLDLCGLSGGGTFLPVINLQCLDQKEYVRDALRLFGRDVNSEILKLESVVEESIVTRGAMLNFAAEIKEMVLVDIGNEALNKDRKNFYMGQLMNFEQLKFSCFRKAANQITGLKATSSILGYFTPHLTGSESVISEVFGFESVAEVIELKQFLYTYSGDLENAPVELEQAQAEYDKASRALNEIVELLKL